MGYLFLVPQYPNESILYPRPVQSLASASSWPWRWLGVTYLHPDCREKQGREREQEGVGSLLTLLTLLGREQKLALQSPSYSPAGDGRRVSPKP